MSRRYWRDAAFRGSTFHGKLLTYARFVDFRYANCMLFSCVRLQTNSLPPLIGGPLRAPVFLNFFNCFASFYCLYYFLQCAKVLIDILLLPLRKKKYLLARSLCVAEDKYTTGSLLEHHMLWRPQGVNSR